MEDNYKGRHNSGRKAKEESSFVAQQERIRAEIKATGRGRKDKIRGVKGHYNDDQKPPFAKHRIKTMFKHVLNFHVLFKNYFPHKRFIPL